MCWDNILAGCELSENACLTQEARDLACLVTSTRSTDLSTNEQ